VILGAIVDITVDGCAPIKKEQKINPKVDLKKIVEQLKIRDKKEYKKHSHLVNFLSSALFSARLFKFV